MKKVYVTWSDVNGYVQDILRQMQQDNWIPDIIVGVTRGGATPAIMMSHYLDVKMVGLDVSLRGKKYNNLGPETNCWLAEDAMAGNKILIVDDLNDEGGTINWIVNDWGKKIAWGDNVKFATLIDNLPSKAIVKVSYTAKEIDKNSDPCWIVLPWEEFYNPLCN